MSRQNIQNFNSNNLVRPNYFREKIRILQEQLPSILDDFKKYYVFYNKNPDFDEYKNMFENMKTNLENLSSQLFSLSNKVDVNTEEINRNLRRLNLLITEERRKNRRLKTRLGIVDSKYDGSHEMINDYNKMYDNDYLKNWALFLGIIISCTILGINFRKKDSINES